MNNIDKDSIRKQLSIDTSSPHAFEQELRNHARVEAEYLRMLAQANKEVNKLEYDLEIIVAEIIKDIIEEYEKQKKSFPQSARAELRRSEVPLDNRYQKIKKRLIDAYETRDMIAGLVKAFSSRSHRLTELHNMLRHTFFGVDRSYGDESDDAFDNLQTGRKGGED